jgi:hypothetical protein
VYPAFSLSYSSSNRLIRSRLNPLETPRGREQIFCYILHAARILTPLSMRFRESTSGATFLAALSGTLALSLWIDQSDFSAVRTGDRVGYTLCFRGRAFLVADAIGIALALLAVHAIVQRLVRGRWPADLPSSRELRYLRPLFLVAINLFGLTAAWFADEPWWPPMAYAAVDLHLFVWLAAAALVAVEINQTSAGALARRIRALLEPLTPRRLLFADLAVVSIAAIAVTLSSAAAFSSVVVGDEPKYLRYCESWWQGLGVEVDGVRDVSSLQATDRPHLDRTLAMIGPAVRADVVSLIGDLKFLSTSRHWRHRFNKAEDLGAAFIRGKDGGLYQMHNPGIAAVILPAYFIDRSWFDDRKGKFADDLFAVNLAFLTMFAVLAGTVFRLGLAYGATPGGAIAIALAIALSLPVGAFPFQFYPEMLAAVIVCLVFRHLLLRAPLGHASAAGWGFSLGLLGWLHVRFDLLALIGVGWMTWQHRADGRPLAVMVTVFGIASALLSLYAYHVTGSVLPWALYPPTGGPPQFVWALVPTGMLSLAFDSNYGMMPLNPLFLLTVPGVALMWRRDRRAVMLLLTFVAALAGLTSGHRLDIAGTTPLRYVLAVVPLAALPFVEWLNVARRRPLATVMFAGLFALSASNCLAHNLANDDKTATTMVASGYSGWNPSLLFPRLYGRPWTHSGFDVVALLLWTGITVGLTVWAIRSKTNEPVAVRLSALRAETLAAVWLTALAVAGAGAVAGDGPRRARQFLPGALHPDRVAEPRASGHCWLMSGGQAAGISCTDPRVPASPILASSAR